MICRGRSGLHYLTHLWTIWGRPTVEQSGACIQQKTCRRCGKAKIRRLW